MNLYYYFLCAFNIQVMKTVADALDILQGEQNMYLGYLLPTITALKHKLSSLPGLKYSQSLKTAILSGIERRYVKF